VKVAIGTQSGPKIESVLNGFEVLGLIAIDIYPKNCITGIVQPKSLSQMENCAMTRMEQLQDEFGDCIYHVVVESGLIQKRAPIGNTETTLCLIKHVPTGTLGYGTGGEWRVPEYIIDQLNECGEMGKTQVKGAQPLDKLAIGGSVIDAITGGRWNRVDQIEVATIHALAYLLHEVE
jgi:non-canonical (house-cleaning) NTP pyrophosphatase